MIPDVSGAVDALVLARANGQRARRLAPPITSVDELWTPETWQHAARRTLAEVVPVLHPTIPNTVEALGALPDGAILRAELGSGAISATREGDKWGTSGSGWLHTSDELARHYSRITEWTVLWPLGGAA